MFFGLHLRETVRHVSKSGRQWTVQVENTIAPSNNRQLGQTSITDNLVILAAGTLGSTEILLRSRERGLSLSDQLGKGFSGNGDEMLIGRDLDAEVNAVAVGVPPRANVDPVGPATIAMIRCRDQDDQDTTVLLQDGTMLPLMAMMAPLKALSFDGCALPNCSARGAIAAIDLGRRSTIWSRTTALEGNSAWFATGLSLTGLTSGKILALNGGRALQRALSNIGRRAPQQPPLRPHSGRAQNHSASARGLCHG